MKKYMTKPVLAVVAAAGIIGCLTPIWANASSIGSPSATKVVMNDEGKQVTRYNLKELATNDPTTLNMLLKTQADHLYIIVDDLKLDTKLQTYMEENKEEWERIYQEHYADIWLEVRFSAEEDEIVSVSAQTEDNKVYVKGIVSPGVTKVAITKPNGDTIEVVPTSERSFTVSFASLESTADQYVTVKAYEGTALVDTEKVKLISHAVDEADMVIHTVSVLDAKKKELKVKGIVKLGADKVYVTYNGVKKEAEIKKLWDGVGSFSVTLKDVKVGTGKALVEVYENGKKRDSEYVEVQVVNAQETVESDNYAIKGTAVLDAKDKKIHVKGSVQGLGKEGDEGKAMLYIVAPDGQKHDVNLSEDEKEFDVKLSYKNRSYSAKAIHLEFYLDGKLVAKADFPHGTPVNEEDGEDEKKDKDKDKDKDKHPNGNAYGYWKKHGQSSNDDDKDDDNDRDAD